MKQETPIVLTFALGVGLLLALLGMLALGTPGPAAAGPPAWSTPRPPDPAFVKPGGTGALCLQSAPCGSIQYAIDQGEPGNGDTIYVAAGVYTSTSAAVITVTKSITLYGGWDGAASGAVVRDPNAYPTTLDGEGTRRVVYVGSNITVTIEGLTVTNGVVTDQGAGLYAQNASLTLRETTVYSNVADSLNTTNTYGGGVYVSGGSLHVISTTFRANDAWCSSCTSTQGGGVFVSNAVTATIENSLFEDNDAWHGGGMWLGEGPVFIRGNRFQDNGWGNSPGSGWAGYGGGLNLAQTVAQVEGNIFSHNRASNDSGAIQLSWSNVWLAGNTIADNSSSRTAGISIYNVSVVTATNNMIVDNQPIRSDGSGVYVGNSQAYFLHNTIARNTGSNGGYGIKVSSSTVALTNTILVSHTTGISVTAGSTARLEGTLWGNGGWANGTDWGGGGTIVTGTVNLWNDPAFVDPDAGDYHIGPDSAAIDAGVDAGVTSDIDGGIRPVGNLPDIGADEVWRQVYLPTILKNYGS